MHVRHPLDVLVNDIGLETVDWPMKTRGCGGSLTGTIQEAGLRLTYILIEEAKERGIYAVAGAPSPHYADIPEMLDLARALDLDFPEEITVVAVEAADPLTIGGAMTPEMLAAIWEVRRRVTALLRPPEPMAHESPGPTGQPGRGW